MTRFPYCLSRDQQRLSRPGGHSTFTKCPLGIWVSGGRSTLNWMLCVAGIGQRNDFRLRGPPACFLFRIAEPHGHAGAQQSANARSGYRPSPAGCQWTPTPAKAIPGNMAVPGSARRSTTLPAEGALISVQLIMTSARPAWLLPGQCWPPPAGCDPPRRQPWPHVDASSAVLASRRDRTSSSSCGETDGNRPISDSGRIVWPAKVGRCFRCRLHVYGGLVRFARLGKRRLGLVDQPPAPDLSGFPRRAHQASQEPVPAVTRRRPGRAFRAQSR